MVLRLDGSWTVVQGVQNVLLRGSGVRYFVENSDPKCALEKKRLRIDVTKEEDHTGLRKIHLDRSGPKLNKIQARLELPTPASSTPEISIVAPTECGVVAWLFTATRCCCVFHHRSLGANQSERSRTLIAEQKHQPRWVRTRPNEVGL